jgi:hypothetical protein
MADSKNIISLNSLKGRIFGIICFFCHLINFWHVVQAVAAAKQNFFLVLLLVYWVKDKSNCTAIGY